MYFEDILLPYSTSPVTMFLTLHSFPPHFATFIFLFPPLLDPVCVAKLPWNVVSLQGVTLLKKTVSTSPSSYQSTVAPQLVVGFCAHFPSFMLGFYLSLLCVDLVHAATIAENSYVCLPY